MNNDYDKLFGLDEFHKYVETEPLNDLKKNEAPVPKRESFKSKISLKPVAKAQKEKPKRTVDLPRMDDNQADTNSSEFLGEDVFSLFEAKKASEARRTAPKKPPERQSKGSSTAPNAKNIKKKKFKDVANFLLPTFIALVIALGLRGFVFTNTTVPTGSMLNTIQLGSRLIGSKLSYDFGKDPERFDIVIFKYPDNEKENYVKRVIGLPGETVEIIDGKVYINGSKTPLKDNFVTTGTPTGNYGPYKVPANCYFMLGDNRSNSNDSRFWKNQFVNEKKIIAKVIFQYYPSIEKIK